MDCACLMRRRTSPAIPVAKICIGGEGDDEVEAEVFWMELEERVCRCPIRGFCNADGSVDRKPTIVELGHFTTTACIFS